jgi:hypothetical protein
VGANSQRLASVVLALTLSGTPALLAACALLCAPGVAATAADTPDHAACCIPDRDVPAGSHAHHGAHDTPATSTALGDVGPGHRSHMTGADASCCPDSQMASLAATATGRADGSLVVASPAVAPVTRAARPPTGTVRTGTPHWPLRAPARPPLVLRI